MNEDDIGELDAYEAVALLRGALHFVTVAMSSPPLCECGRPKCWLNAQLCLEHGGCCECGADEMES